MYCGEQQDEWLCPCERGQKHLGLLHQKLSQWVKGFVYISLLRTLDTAAGILCLVWGFTVQERHWRTGVSLVEAHQAGQGMEHMAYEERLGHFKPKKGRFMGDFAVKS